MIGPALFNKTFAFVIVSKTLPIVGAPFGSRPRSSSRTPPSRGS
jgi:hypothetical protein